MSERESPGSGGSLAPMPEPGPNAWAWRLAGRSLRALNRWLMVPAHRAGLGPWLGTPFGGYILLLRVRGRRSGRWRETPLSYLVTEGDAWVLAGFGPAAEWYRNLLADPGVEVWLGGRTIPCRAEPADDPRIRRRIIPALVRASGIAGLMIGCNPWRAADDEVLASVAWVPLVRLCPVGTPLVAGPDDPGGLGWTWRQGILLLVGFRLLRLARRPGRRLEG
jgi:deazaflavin-dependent oxidoreductase (nitroreductase family)